MKDQGRYFLKDSIRRTVDFSMTDQSMGVEPPPVQKPCPPEAARVDLPYHGRLGKMPLAETIGKRESRHKYGKEYLSLEELSFLLWATQGLKGAPSGGHAFRTVPSAGCRHAIETYLAVFRIKGLEKGIYRYLPVEHQLTEVSRPDGIERLTVGAALNQKFAGSGAATFIWTAIPYRMEWRYSEAAYKVIAIDAGHICQNLYLACEAIEAGTCAIAAYDQEKADALVGVDGEDEFVIYMAPVGKIEAQ
ncbi:MAG TPA: SagB/ThcOx family dehydrogenase [Synergistales bacterium]|nr:SagB/ThcOx family dehydrogenase [Synergistales bacterium]